MPLPGAAEKTRIAVLEWPETSVTPQKGSTILCLSV